MARIKHYESSSGAVTVAFCAEKPAHGPALLAAGTLAGGVDITFSTSSQLELLAVDLSSPQEQLSVVGSLQVPERFHRLAWGQRVAADAGFPPMGLLAGGLADGSVCLWDPAVMAMRLEGRPPLLARMQKHTGAVRGLDFNTFSPNLLATGASDSDLCIWDLAKPGTPSLYPALKGSSPQAGPGGNEIMHLAWNPKVQHILASCSSNGATTVWDLKHNKPVMSLRDPNSQRHASVLAWNPEVATQLVVASDDDRSPTLQMWDLRNTTGPLKEFVGHSKGVLGMSWCLHDPALLLSCGKDQRTICWDINAADAVGELHNAGGVCFDVAWAPHARGVFATSSMDGCLALNHIHACTGGRVVETMNADFTITQTTTGDSTPLKRVPQWMKRPCGAVFGFGGKLVQLTNHKVQMADANGQPVVRDQGWVTISQVVSEPALVSQSEAFEAAVAGGDRASVQAFCASKAEAAKAANLGDEAQTWAFLSLLFVSEPDARTELLRKLGFEDVLPAPPQPQQQSVGGVPDANGSLAGGVEGLNLQDGSRGGALPPNGVPPVSADAFFDQLPQESDVDFFDKVPQDESLMAPGSPAHSAAAPTPKGSRAGDGSLAGRVSHVATSAVEGPDASSELEDEIMRALIAGNVESAVDACFKAHRLADALLIANIINSELYKRTMHRYMKLVPKPYMALIRAMVDGEYEGLVKMRPVGQWRETLALLATYTNSEEFGKQCDVLAGRLAAAGMHHAALLCHICAGNVDAAVGAWARACGAAANVDALQAVIEKSVVMGFATGRSKASTALSDLVANYAGLLAAQGRLTTALDYLDYAPGEASTTVAVLKDRICRSGVVQLRPHQAPPPFPFTAVDVQPAATPAAAHAAHAAHAATSAQPASQWPGTTYSAAPAAPTPAANYGATAATTYQGHQPAQPSYNYGQPAQPTYAQPAQPAYTQPAAATNYAQPAAPTSYAQPAAPTSYAQPAAATSYNTSYGAAPQGYGGSSAAAPGTGYSTTAQGYGYPAATANAVGYGAAPPAQVAAPPPTTFTPVSTTMGSTIGTTTHHGGSGGGMGHAAPGAMHMENAPGTTGTSGGGGGVYIPKRASAAPPAAPVSTPAPSMYAAGGQPVAAVQPPPASTYPSVAPAVSGFTPTTTVPPVAVPAAGMYGQPLTSMPSAGAAPTTPPAPPAAPPAPTGPPANITVSSADTSKVPAEQRPIVTSLTGLFNSCMALATNPAKKREMDDNSRKLGQLLWRLNQGDVSEGVLPKLHQLCQAIDAADWATANHLQVQMTTTDWEECGFWLSAVKRLIKMRQMSG